MELKKPVVLTNLSSSSSDDISGQITALFERYGYGRPTLLQGQSRDMKTMMDAMRDARGDLLVSYGGDGTGAAVASIAREQNVPFIPLPGGTMNMLMVGLYGTDDWRDCLLRGLASAKPRPMTAGKVFDARGLQGQFMVGCMFGKPTQMSEAREELRDGQVGNAVTEALGAMRATKAAAPIHFAAADDAFGEHALDLINVTCPFMDGEALDPDVFDITLFETVTGGSTLSLGLSALLGNLKNSQEVEKIRTRSFRLRSTDPIEGLLDGEPHTFEGEVRVELDKSSGLVMAPYPAISFRTARAQELRT